ncbi:MAG: hypothetical protein ACTTID_02400 [Bacillales bacterium]
MNPGKGKSCRFDTSIYKRNPGFKWAYDFDYYFNSPKFPEFYKQIKNIMEDKDTVVFGYAVDNDIRYLNSACMQYNLKPISYIAYDVKLIKESCFKKKQKVKGLKGAFLELCGLKKLFSLTPHLSIDDSKMTMMIFKQICKNMTISVVEILDLCNNCKIDSIKYIEKYEIQQKEKLLHPEKYIKKRKINTNCKTA